MVLMFRGLEDNRREWERELHEVNREMGYRCFPRAHPAD